MKQAAQAPTAPSPDTPLARRLRLLATAPLPAAPTDLMERLLQEIDEIVLPRVLSLRITDGQVAEFHVAQRALMRLCWQGCTLPRPDAPDGAGSGGDCPETAATDFARTLWEISARLPANARVELTRRAAAVRPHAAACKAPMLRAAIAACAPASVQDVLTAARTQALAACAYHTDTRGVERSPPDSAFAPMLDAALAQLRQDQPLNAPGPALCRRTPRLHLLPLSPDLQLALARIEGLDLALVLPAEQARALAQAWQHALT
ncbi:hypothetical protein MHM88_08875 [Epibacterium sp. MM17-32]|uniref:hypothetical protein n=1 Tax=Epibacterium sp. MM17-32 TaxID=2917734 RepID=UPI001EF4A60A|nr:hypothetical protein [Epibacterium sp. MM17-32]MCG7627915.1 hypothetical protein [Epibacterium sp. MM17-32]